MALERLPLTKQHMTREDSPVESNYKLFIEKNEAAAAASRKLFGN